jgi:hypothetical protein
MDAMARLLKDELDYICIEVSHGFREGRGAKTFFYSLAGWPEMDALIQCDVVKCMHYE